MQTPLSILKQHWGHQSFRPVQQEIIDAVLSQKDALALLPTGGGKSICFQVPALMREGMCIVISPLIALIKDQVENLEKRGIKALSVHAGMNYFDVKRTFENALHGNYKFLYVSPERLLTNLFLEYLPGLNVSMIAVDESHCISQWGYDFRPAYLKIAALREYLPNIPVIALTASATPKVQEDICDKLHFRKGYERFQQSFERPNLSYSVFSPPSKETKIIQILNNVPGTAIVYCKSRKRTQQIADLLKMNGISADYYHAGLLNDERSNKQQSWISNKTRVMVCTNAFGMGIDKPDVRTVIHADVPDCLENYYQEAGRAGRDGKRSYAVLLHEQQEIYSLQQTLATKYPDFETLKAIYTSLMNFLQVAAGSGESMSFDFDISVFANNFKLDILQANYVIKFFQQQGLLTFNETVFRPSTIQFFASKEVIAAHEQKYPKHEPIIKALLRAYEGIFDYPVNIYETAIAKFAKTPIEAVKQILPMLHSFGIIDYNKASEMPQIFLIENRMYANAFTTDMQTMHMLKQRAAERLAALKKYVEDTAACRGKMIAAYFGDETRPCGICDNCINAKQKPLASEEFDKYYNKLKAILAEGPKTLAEITSKLSSTEKEKFSTLIDFLIKQNRLAQEAGKIFFI